MKKYKLILVLFLMIVSLKSAFTQEHTKNALTYSLGIGAAENSKSEGLGITFGLGYQREVWNDRFRIHPNFSFGIFNNAQTTDVSDVHFNTINLRLDLNYDLLRIKAFSLFIGTGVTVSHSIGLLGTGGRGIDGPSRTSSDFFRETNFAGNGLIGLRFNPQKRKMAYELLLLNGSLGVKSDYVELKVFQVRMVRKL